MVMMKVKYYMILICAVWAFNEMIGQPVVNKNAIKTLKVYNETAVNTANLESSPAFVGDRVAFVYTVTGTKFFDKNIGEPYFQLGSAMVHMDNSLGEVEAFNKKINSDWHEGPMSYDLNTNRLFFTRSNKDRKVLSTKADTFYLRILTADLNKSKPVVTPIEINVKNYSICHPSLSKDGKMMIFSSNQPGGRGKMDLYSAYFNGVEWTGVLNLGDRINTENNEIFPYLANDSILIFASDRPGGLGGLDMFVSVLRKGEWSKPELLPTPLNSAYDDLGLIIRDNLRSGYFASNRPGGKGKDDIYRFETEETLIGIDMKAIVSVRMHIMDKLTLEDIPMATVTMTPLHIDVNNFALSSYNIDMLSGKDAGDLILKLSPKKGSSFPPFKTDSEGRATFQIKRSQTYLLNMEAEGYNSLSMIYDFNAIGSHFNIVLEPAEEKESNNKPVEQPEEMAVDKRSEKTQPFAQPEVGQVLVFDDVYFGYNSAVLEDEAVPELIHLAEYMVQNPNARIRIESHTDSRGSAEYNLQLSISRANAVREYLVKKGVDEDRMEIRGFGETKLRNHCKDNVPCSEKEHRYNRRTEIELLEK
ncbi:MAG: OmpA/MotB domain-containing protein [Bacteroidetes bacterium OLB9]|nr:MAG: OmpA/MotB domain-containing protein [Bacteroidetes bacterium OLB9]